MAAGSFAFGPTSPLANHKRQDNSNDKYFPEVSSNQKLSDFITLSISKSVLVKLNTLLFNDTAHSTSSFEDISSKEKASIRKTNKEIHPHLLSKVDINPLIEKVKTKEVSILRQISSTFKQLLRNVSSLQGHFSKKDLAIIISAPIKRQLLKQSPPIDIIEIDNETKEDVYYPHSSRPQKIQRPVYVPPESSSNMELTPKSTSGPFTASTPAPIASNLSHHHITTSTSSQVATSYFDPFESNISIKTSTFQGKRKAELPVKVSPSNRSVIPSTPSTPTKTTHSNSISTSMLKLFLISSSPPPYPGGSKKFLGISPITDYVFLDKVGEGTFGEVHRARHRPTGRLVALKKILHMPQGEGFPLTSLREIRILKQLNHQNVISILEIAVSHSDGTFFFIVFPFMEHDLVGLLDAPTVTFTLPQIKYYSIQLLQGISYLHQEHFMHRDIKSANILIGNRGELKIADFGLARRFSSKQYQNYNPSYTPGLVTRWYRPPEVLLGSIHYGPGVDIWGVGCIIAELFVREPIFQGNSELHQLTLIFDTLGWPTSSMKTLLDLPDASKLPALISDHTEQEDNKHALLNTLIPDPSMLDLILKLLSIDPSVRISAKEALEHPALTSSFPAPAGISELPVVFGGSFHELAKRNKDAASGTKQIPILERSMANIKKNSSADKSLSSMPPTSLSSDLSSTCDQIEWSVIKTTSPAWNVEQDDIDQKSPLNQVEQSCTEFDQDESKKIYSGHYHLNDPHGKIPANRIDDTSPLIHNESFKKISHERDFPTRPPHFKNAGREYDREHSQEVHLDQLPSDSFSHRRRGYNYYQPHSRPFPRAESYSSSVRHMHKPHPNMFTQDRFDRQNIYTQNRFDSMETNRNGFSSNANFTRTFEQGRPFQNRNLPEDYHSYHQHEHRNQHSHPSKYSNDGRMDDNSVRPRQNYPSRMLNRIRSYEDLHEPVPNNPVLEKEEI